MNLNLLFLSVLHKFVKVGEEAVDLFFGVVKMRGQAHEVLAHGHDHLTLP